MCAKLKCCLNYEVDTYMEATKKLPPRDAVLQTQDKDYHFFKQDILAGQVTYTPERRSAVGLETISAERAHAIIEMNKRGEKPQSLQEDGKIKEPEKPKDMLDGSDLTRFDRAKKKKKKNNNRNRQRDNNQRNDNTQHNDAKQSNDAKQRGDADQQKKQAPKQTGE